MRISGSQTSGPIFSHIMTNCNVHSPANLPLMPPAADPGLVDKLVLANRILYRQGVVDGFGHVSARHDRSPVHFLLARNMAPGLVRHDDILTFDLEGAALGCGRSARLSRTLHPRRDLSRAPRRARDRA
jgi:hypothetical protein